MKFRKKPVVIEAIQWEGGEEGFEKVREFTSSKVFITHYTNLDQLGVPTLEGTMLAEVGDWLIRGVKGEYYPCKPDIFEMTYEKVED